MLNSTVRAVRCRFDPTQFLTANHSDPRGEANPNSGLSKRAGPDVEEGTTTDEFLSGRKRLRAINGFPGAVATSN